MAELAELEEQGMIADIPLRVTQKVYFVRDEDGMVADQGWITVDEARRKNATDRRRFGTYQNRYFRDKESADRYSDSVMGGAPGEPAPGEPMPGGPGAGPEFGMEDEVPDFGAPDELSAPPGLGAPSGPGGMDELGDLGGPDELGDLGGGEPTGLGLDEPEPDLGLEPDEEDELELTVPRRIRLRVAKAESMEEGDMEKCPHCGATHIEDNICQNCRRLVKTKKKEDSGEDDDEDDLREQVGQYSPAGMGMGQQAPTKPPGGVGTPPGTKPDPGEDPAVTAAVYPLRLQMKQAAERGDWEAYSKAHAQLLQYLSSNGQAQQQAPQGFGGPAVGQMPGLESQENTEPGIIEALLSGDVDAAAAVDMLEKCVPAPKAQTRARRAAAKTYSKETEPEKYYGTAAEIEKSIKKKHKKRT